MYSFVNDYSEGAHPRILESLMKSNLEQNAGYGEDLHTKRAKELILKHLNMENADIHFIPGGTQTNLLVISSSLKSYQCVIAADTGHINVHETGAIEATGHKVVTVPNIDGKLTPEAITEVLENHNNEHMVMPAMVYISNSTELGTVYSKSELSMISKVCKENGLLLFMDGARIGSALTSKTNDLELEDIAKLVDVFYIGGTKNGALLGEALIIIKEELKKDFRYYIKQRGALMAKGFITGIQFEVLFEDNLFFELGTHANNMANKISDVLMECGFQFLTPPGTNQLFPILRNELIEGLLKEFSFNIERKIDEEHSAIRFVTSWATTPKSVEALCDYIRLMTMKISLKK